MEAMFLAVSVRLYPALVCLAFVAGLAVLEGAVLGLLSEPGTHHAGFVWRLLFPVGVLAVSLLLPRRARWTMLGVVGTLAAALAVCDLAYHEFFGTVTSAFMLSSLGQLAEIPASVGSLISPADLWPALLFAPFFALAWRPHRVASGPPRSGDASGWIRSPRVWGLMLLGLESLLIVIAMPDLRKDPSRRTFRLGPSSGALGLPLLAPQPCFDLWTVQLSPLRFHELRPKQHIPASTPGD